jgi:tetratricopeptide (TPR) repeat protein
VVEALIHVGDMERATAAVRIFERYAQTNHRCSMSVLRSRALVAQAEGRNEQAVTSLQEAITSAHDSELKREYWQAEYALGNLLLACGQGALAMQAWSHARATVEQIASTITEPSMRTSFLDALYLQRLFSSTVSV